MKANKEFNKKIFEAIKAEAQYYFNEIKEYFEPGTYNAKDLTELIAENATKIKLKEVTRRTCHRLVNKRDPLIIYSVESTGQNFTESTAYNSEKIINIEIDSFKLRFDACKVFDYLTRFARVNGIRETVLFTNEVKTDETPLISFDIDIQKDALDLCKYITVDDLRPVMNQIFISLEYYTLVASDGHILGEKRANITNLKGEGVPRNLFISPEALKRCAGPCKVSYFGDRTIIQNSKGEQYINTIKGSYPNYKSVIPSVLDSAIIPEDYNQIKKFLTVAKKNKSCARFYMEGKAGENKIVLSTCEDLWEGENKKSIIVDLEESINFSFYVAYHIEKFLNLGKFERLYIKDHTTASVLDLPSGYAVLMPLFEEEAYMDANCGYMVHPFLVSSYIPYKMDSDVVCSENSASFTAVDTTTVIIDKTTLKQTGCPSAIIVNHPDPLIEVVTKSHYPDNIYHPQNTVIYNSNPVPLITYIDHICVLVSLGVYMAAKSKKHICRTDIAQKYNTFDNVLRPPRLKERKFLLYEARSG